jgi:hypothetical protein
MSNALTIQGGAEVIYETHGLRSIEAEAHIHEKTGKRSVRNVKIDGRPVDTSERFWTSLFSRYGFGKTVFNYWDPTEVFERVTERRADDRIRFCIYNQPGMVRPSLLAVSNPEKPVMAYDRARELLAGYEPLDKNGPHDGVHYADGILRASYTPRGEAPFEVGGDDFQARFDTMIPIDGFGSPEVSLGCLRLVCTNGMVAFGKVFSNKIPGGSDADGGFGRITQTIEGYGNDEGFDALRRRLGSATESYASVAECSAMSKAVIQALGSAGTDREQTRELIDRFDRVAGNPTMMYGLVSATSVGKKRLATLPSRASVYDLINFGTEVATHHVDQERKSRDIYGVVGSMLSGEYDLEGSKKDGRDFVDVYLDGDDGAAKRAEMLDADLDD